MIFLKNITLLLIVLNGLKVITSNSCVSFKPVLKTRIQWNNGLRLISKRNFLGTIKYKYEPYVYSTIQEYHDYERVYDCCDGYAKIDGSTCKPVCSPSCPANTSCIRPNICECNWGYRGVTASAGSIQCEAVCKPPCDANAECIEPNKCKCNTGYQDTSGSGKCEPICSNGCPENSNCTKPEECSCSTGYKDNGFAVCQPECNPQCPEFSNCTKPNICVCHENYQDEDNKCKPICKQMCPQHAECVRPNECECTEGYESIEHVPIENESIGYEPMENISNRSFRCKAKCSEDCPAFSVCTEPNKCECEEGYRKTEQNLCEPVCEHGCPDYSNCTEPNTCTCEKGYDMRKSNDALDGHIVRECVPVCEKTCPEFASCSEPNKCQCDSGYQLKLSSIYNLYCEPVCQNNCSTFAKCVQPNKCECLEGYKMDEYEKCQPVCSRGCKNGLCFQPEVCICNPGFLMGPQDECEPVCSMVCQNGSCVEPEICQCHEGYKFSNNSVNICEPVCESNCINGICVAPNVCICHENYEPHNTEMGLNHSNCQMIKTTTEDFIKRSSEISDLNKYATISLTSNDHYFERSTKPSPDGLKYSTSSKPLVAAQLCNDQCQCWQEYDEFGSLTFQKCEHLCVDEFDKPCLDLKLCQCDLTKNQLICGSNDEDLSAEDPIYYECNMLRVKVTTPKPLDQGIQSDMKSSKPTETSTFVWWWAVILGILIALCLVGVVVYFHLRTPEDAIIDYEL